MAQFPSAEWVKTLMDKINSDARYAQIAANWEGDMRCVVEASGPLQETTIVYLDLLARQVPGRLTWKATPGVANQHSY